MADKNVNSEKDSDSSPNHKKQSALRNLKTLCKQIIKNRVFLGHYQEKRYVERLKTYKDLVVLNSNEKSFCDDIDLVFKRIQKQINDDNDNGANNDVSVWLGFTAPNVIGAPAAGYCIWSKLNESESNVAFGQYWFQVKTIRFKEQEIELQLNVLRPADISDSNTNLTKFITDDLPKVDWSNLFISWRDAINESTYRFMHEQITTANIIAAIKFLALIVVLVAVGSVHSIKYLGDFTLKFMHESSKLLRAVTPFAISALNVFSKIVGGFYILLAMMWRDTVGGGGARRGGHSLPAIQGRQSTPRIRYRPATQPHGYDRSNSVLYR